MFGSRSAGQLILSAALMVASSSAAASVLLLEDGGSLASSLDCMGIDRALTEAGIATQRIDVQTSPVSGLELDAAVVVACHLDFGLDPLGASVLDDWVSDGGGLLATGRSGYGLQGALQLISITPVDGGDYSELRFVDGAATTSGIGWEGPITSGETLPISLLPATARHFYEDESQGGWPSYEVTPAFSLPTGHWRNSTHPWSDPNGGVATTIVGYNSGRAMYSGALPGVHVNWDWPRAWRTVIVHAVEWLAGDHPLVELGYWPEGHSAALAWSGDTEKPAMETAVPAILALFDELGLERFGTFYMVGRSGGDAGTSGAQEHPGVVAAILAAGSELAGHGDIHTALGGQSYATQRQRLEDMRGLIEPLMPVGAPLLGFRAPYLSQNTATWQALSDLGFDYDAGDADTWSHVTLPHPRGGLLQLPPSMPMDWHLFEQYGLSDADAQAIWFDKFDYVFARRGLFSWIHHPWVIEGHLDGVENLLRHAIDRGDVWLARQDDIARWWQARDGLTIEHLPALPGRIRVRVTNTGTEPVTGASVWVKLPEGQTASWAARIDGRRVELLERLHGPAGYRIAVVDELAAGDEALVEFMTEDALFEDGFDAQQGWGGNQEGPHQPDPST